MRKTKISYRAAAGVAEGDIQTTQLTIQPEYEYTDQGQRLLGYTARNGVRSGCGRSIGSRRSWTVACARAGTTCG